MPNPKTFEILRNARETLETARHGLAVVKGKPDDRRIGTRNMIIFGRMVTAVLLKLKSTEPEYESWFKPYGEIMGKDPLLKFIKNVRNEIEHEGILNTAQGNTSMKNFRLEDIPRPPNATNFFIGDQLGGSGWDIILPDGTKEKYYVDLPEKNVKVDFILSGAPTEHLGKSIGQPTIENIGSHYLRFMENLISDAEIKFLGYPTKHKPVDSSQARGPYVPAKIIPFRKKDP